ncbi:hypothetical protein BU15DRAFT_74701 [Melanogaster broomeanus]|nr:hypothetical protein BU15DRAFT_74701 [Melanogaster broomeanus]
MSELRPRYVFFTDFARIFVCTVPDILYPRTLRYVLEAGAHLRSPRAVRVPMVRLGDMRGPLYMQTADGIPAYECTAVRDEGAGSGRCPRTYYDPGAVVSSHGGKAAVLVALGALERDNHRDRPSPRLSRISQLPTISRFLGTPIIRNSHVQNILHIVLSGDESRMLARVADYDTSGGPGRDFEIRTLEQLGYPSPAARIRECESEALGRLGAICDDVERVVAFEARLVARLATFPSD